MIGFRGEVGRKVSCFQRCKAALPTGDRRKKFINIEELQT